MKNNIQFTEKNLRRLLDSNYRKKILSMFPKDKNGLSLDCIYKINDYAKYIVDSQIVSRDEKLKDNKEAFYGFSPINFICAVKNNGTIDKKLLEFRQINHFLKDYQGEIAIDVAKCILILWLRSDKSIKNFDYELIDAELAKIEKEYLEKQQNEKKETTETKQSELSTAV